MSIIVTFIGDIAQYLIEAKTWFDEISNRCPLCGAQTHRHGHYKRTVWSELCAFHIPIFRRYCPDCDKTFSYIPSFIKPYARFLNSYRLDRFQSHVLDQISIRKTVGSLSTVSITPISITTFRRWLKRLRTVATDVNKFLIQRLLGLQPSLSPPSGRVTDLIFLLQRAIQFHLWFCEITGESSNSLGVFDLLNLELPVKLWL